MKVVTGEEGRTMTAAVVVGVKLDSESRELLTWTLVKLAEPGDRVVAVHILPADGEDADESSVAGAHLEESNAENAAATTPFLSLVKDLDSMVSVYEGFCNLKQIDLKWKVCRSSSIRKALVREAKSFSATKLVLGVPSDSKSTNSFAPSVVKYCSKRLPSDCQVLGVKNGKILFKRESLEKIRNKIHKQSKQIAPKECVALSPCSSEVKLQSKSSMNSSTSDEAIPSPLSKADCSIGSPAFVRSHSSDQMVAMKSGFEPRETEPPSQRSKSFDTRYDRQLRMIAVKERLSNLRRKNSVVRWVKQLTNNCDSCSPSHHDRIRGSKSYVNAAFDVEKEMIDVENSPFSSVVHCGEEELQEELEIIKEKYSTVFRLFSDKELQHATSNFSNERLIGKGGSSRVYQGSLSDGQELAVKVLEPSANALREFSSELEIITTLHHKNIISLIGFSAEIGRLILVFDFFPMGSLEQLLHGRDEGRKIFSWEERYNVVIGVAEALCYLHGSGTDQPVIHRDVKSSNILIDENFESRLSDFGLAKRAKSSVSCVTCNDVEGTFGYLAPEYFMYGKVNEKVDVYAFGVVLLELISGRKPINTGSNGQESVVVWAKAILKSGKNKELVDPCLIDDYDAEQLDRMALAASLCIRRSSRTRPRMGLVLKLLQGNEYAVEWGLALSASLINPEAFDDETTCQDSDISSHINLALRDDNEDSVSITSSDQATDSTATADYLQECFSRSSSFD